MGRSIFPNLAFCSLYIQQVVLAAVRVTRWEWVKFGTKELGWAWSHDHVASEQCNAWRWKLNTKIIFSHKFSCQSAGKNKTNTALSEGSLSYFLCFVARLSLYVLWIDSFPSRELASWDISYSQIVVFRFLFSSCASLEVLWRPPGEACRTLWKPLD